MLRILALALLLLALVASCTIKVHTPGPLSPDRAALIIQIDNTRDDSMDVLLLVDTLRRFVGISAPAEVAVFVLHGEDVRPIRRFAVALEDHRTGVPISVSEPYARRGGLIVITWRDPGLPPAAIAPLLPRT